MNEIEDLVESAVILDRLASSYVRQDLVESASLSDNSTVQSYAYVNESAVLHGAFLPSLTLTTNVTEKGVITDAVYVAAKYTHDITEQASLSNTLYLSNPYTLVRESARVFDGVHTQRYSLGSITDEAWGSGRAVVGVVEDVRDSAGAVDHLSHSTRSVLGVVDTATVNSISYEGATLVTTVTELARLNDFTTSTYLLVDNITDRGFVSSALLDTLEANESAWTANMVNWAMSSYSGISFTGKLGQYAVGPDGLYVESDEEVQAEIATGKLIVGSGRKKSLTGVYTLASSDEPLGVAVTADVGGTEHTHEYTQMARKADEPRSVRCSVGRGFNSTYFKLKFSTAGKFALHQVELDIAELGRRI
jgi:hypothetical protein